MAFSKQFPPVSLGIPYVDRGPGTISSVAPSGPLMFNGYLVANKDAFEDGNKLAFCKRPGAVDFEYATGKTNMKSTNNGEVITGLCTTLDKSVVLWTSKDATKEYGNSYIVSTNTLVQTDISAYLDTSDVCFTVLDGMNYGSSGGQLVIAAATNGSNGILVGSAYGYTQITDADFTGNGVKTNFVGIDGYLFYGVISGTNAGRIYNSDLGSSTAYTATSYLVPQDIPGNIVKLGRIRNYLVCFKQYSIEFFENVGNPTPGSPLEPRKHLTKPVGCASASSVQEVSDGIIFLGVDSNGKIKMCKLRYDSLDVEVISDTAVDAIVQNAKYNIGGFQSFSNDIMTTSFSAVAKGQSQVIVWQNKELYAIVCYSVDGQNACTMVYDNNLKVWSQWATAFVGGSSDDTFIPSMCFLINNGTSGYWTCFVNNYNASTASSTDKARFNIFTFDSLVTKWFQDQYELATTNCHDYEFTLVTPMFDFGSQDRKFIHSLELVYDCLPLQSTVPDATTHNIYLYYHQNDYNNAGGVFTRTLEKTGMSRVKYHQLGSARRVAFTFYNAGNIPVRIWGFNIVWSNGVSHA
jgi:hypothetical protein